MVHYNGGKIVLKLYRFTVIKKLYDHESKDKTVEKNTCLITFIFSENSNYGRESLPKVKAKHYWALSTNFCVIEGEGDGIKYRLPFKIFSTLHTLDQSKLFITFRGPLFCEQHV